MSKELITQAVATLIRNHGRRIVAHAYLTRGNGSGTLIADQASRKAFYWMPGSDGAPKVAVATLHPQSSIIFQNSVDYETIPVDIGYVEHDDTLYIMGENSFGVSGGGGTTIVERAITAAADKTVVLPLSVQADQNQPSLVVWVQAYTFDIAGTIYQFPTTAVDLTSYIPGTANYMCYAVLFLQSDYTTIEVQTSTPRSASGIPLNGTDVQVARTAATSTSLAIFAVKLVNGQTTIAQSDLNQDGDPLQQNLNTLASPGNVSGPGSSTDYALADWNGTAGTTLRSSGLLTDATNKLTIPGRLVTQSGRNVAVRVVTAAGAVTVTTTDDVVVVNKTSGAATVVNLPSSPTKGDTYAIKDGKGDGATNNLTLTPASGNIDGSPTFVININYGGVFVTYNGTQWNVTTFFSAGSGTVTSVGLSSDAGYLTVASTPVTTAGTITINKTTGKPANQVVATPNGSTGTADLRVLVDADLPTALAGHTISGGTIDNTVIGGTTEAAGSFTALEGDTLQINNESLDPSAVAQFDSTTQGILPPSMTTTQRNAISSPKDGLIVYDTTLHQLWQYQNGAWAQVGASGGGGGSSITKTTKTLETRTRLWDKTLSSDGTFDTNNSDDFGHSGSLDQTYDNFEILIQGRSAGTDKNTKMQFNNDSTAASYIYEQLYGGASAAANVGSGTGTFIGYEPGSADTANYFGVQRIFVANYTKTDRYKMAEGYSDGPQSSSAGLILFDHFTWLNTAAITRIQSFPGSSNNYLSGSRLIVVGVKTETVVTDVSGAGTQQLTQGADGTVSNTTTETSLLAGVVGTQTFAAAALSSVGRTLWVKAWGYITDLLTPTLEIKLKLGSTVVLDTGALTLVTLTGSQLWIFEGSVTVQTAGASGKVIGQGQFVYNQITKDILQTSQTSIDLTPTLLVDLTAQFGTASSSNKMVCNIASVQVWN